MGTRTAARGVSDSYFQLVKQFPLTHLRDDAHARAAQAMIDRLLQEELDAGAEAYLDVLTDLVESYEEVHEPILDVSEADVLRELIRASGLTQQDLGKKVGMPQSTISAVLGGSRSLTKDQIVALSKYFHISPTAFLPA